MACVCINGYADALGKGKVLRNLNLADGTSQLFFFFSLSAVCVCGLVVRCYNQHTLHQRPLRPCVDLVAGSYGLCTMSHLFFPDPRFLMGAVMASETGFDF